MSEAEFQTRFNRYLKYKWDRGTSCFELKLARTKRLPLSNIKDHQIAALHLANTGKQIYKIADSGLGQKPYDCYAMDHVPAYLVIQFYKPATKEFYLIPIARLKKFMHENPGIRSLTEEYCLWIGEKLLFN